MRIDIITIFPKMFEPVLGESIIKRAQAKGKVSIYVHDLRGYTLDKHHKVDDRPFGGGPGMGLSADPIFRAVDSIVRRTAPACPAGRYGVQRPKRYTIYENDI